MNNQKTNIDDGIVVLSLFDGMSCGQIALSKLGIKVKAYYAAEIDKHAIKVTQHNFPDTIQLGDVTKVFAKDLPMIDLLIGGSPCQGFSFAGKQLAFDDPRSKLFFEFVRLKNECNPKYFMLENVKMKKEFEIIVSKYMGVSPIEINSALLSAQNRVRLYWTNIAAEPYGLFGDMQCAIQQPKDKKVFLRDILESDVAEKYYLSDKMLNYFINRAANFNQGKVNIREENQKASCLTSSMSSCLTSSMSSCDIPDNYIAVLNNNGELRETIKSTCLDANYSKGMDNHAQRTMIIDRKVIQLSESTESQNIQPYQQNRVYDINGISPALLSNMSCGSHAILVPEATKKGFVEIKPGECFDFDHPNSKTRKGRNMNDKSNCLMSKETDFMHYTDDYRIRRLTPTECERLQTVPDGYTSIVSDTQRYRMLGNGWTVDVIAYIFSFMKLHQNE